ncbi:MAG: PHP domain-containing protein, partial [Spirochaetota bacterium]
MRPVLLEQHSVYSLCEGVPFISELVDQARGAGERYLALCDTNGFYGVVNFVTRCREEGLIPLIGTRLHHPSFDGLLIARDMKGYAQISALVSGVHLDRGRNGRRAAEGGNGEQAAGSCSGREYRHGSGQPAFNLKDRILRRPRRRFVVITRDRDVLERGGEGVYAEINVLRPNYIRDYARARKLGVPPVFI